ncbi:NADPH-dependent FMN reductase [Candidatus Palauibacter sp.]|uniref:NADPH-dependent FMN reductase n=1 Tax=Candidatus Palauibacter sp. TaxID=3101350 RepID=UPI003AF2EFD0
MLAMAGSQRRRSFNRALLRAALERIPEGVESREFDPSRLPFYDGDLEAAGDPDPVKELKEAVRAADLVLLVTPEYNGGLPAVLKNAVDWGSRPPRPQAWDGRPVAIMGATPGRLGTALAQRSLRESLAGLNARVMPQPRILLAGAGALFDGDLRLADEAIGQRLDKFMSAAAEWALRFR